MPECELRQIHDGRPVCWAAGGRGVLEPGQGESQVLKGSVPAERREKGSPQPGHLLCTGCTIPDSLRPAEKPCLYLIPLRIDEDGSMISFYACRWFYQINPQRLMHSTSWCKGCPYWFPRPTVHLIKDYLATNRKVLKVVTGGKKPRRG